ncbi:thioesterase family protein [Shewanella youngdeokensis]|uniref:Thioesterase family protein n=1 Tax=Shewanella youngdeokensis TaxID=2999068 RepID=A0ABZ0JYK1_9GAMM|nr:thioesterase family protein [Shewanella sp. DAU334]
MNLYFRLIWLLTWRINRAKKIGLLHTSKLRYRVLPSDCDANLHLTNSRYPAFMDLARIHMLSQVGVLKRFMTLGWMPIVNAVEMTYIRDIKPFAKFSVETRMVGWDEKYFYIEHRFVSDRGLHCIAFIRGVFVCKRKVVPIADMLAEAKFDGPSPEIPVEIAKWKSFLKLKKAQNQTL